MVRPVGSPANKALALLFATHATAYDVDRQVSIARTGANSLFDVFAQVFPNAVRGIGGHARGGVSNCEVNKMAEGGGFERSRFRAKTLHIGLSNKVLPDTPYRFARRRWWDPDVPGELQQLRMSWLKLSAAAKPSTSFQAFCDILRKAISAESCFMSNNISSVKAMGAEGYVSTLARYEEAGTPGTTGWAVLHAGPVAFTAVASLVGLESEWSATDTDVRSESQSPSSRVSPAHQALSKEAMTVPRQSEEETWRGVEGEGWRETKAVEGSDCMEAGGVEEAGIHAIVLEWEREFETLALPLALPLANAAPDLSDVQLSTLLGGPLDLMRVNQ